MRTETETVTRLRDYRPSDYLVDRIEIEFRLHPTATLVRSRLLVRPNPAGRAGAPLFLDGDEVRFHAVELDDAPLDPGAFSARPDGFVLHAPPPRPFTLTFRTEVDPSANTKLMGLYRSGGVYCTQCEADGFRRISYQLDRPDVLSVWTTRIEADAEEAPVLLGNGNLREAGTLPDGRHFAVWHDPFPKPAYLFAIVGGRLAKTSAPFTTRSGRSVEIAVWVEPGKESRATYALDALERSMRWDERVFGREYDLDVFNVVAVSDFNMGAMENKGLNIFNDRYVLASADTATDADYANIEAVIAHEYFHNWTGNRITCRDWFQLCLKEGLTVFRDQEFSSDERSRSVHRIAEVRTLRTRQFAEDAGPLSHPVRPSEYREINNFYTATVYEKGAEIVRMLRTMLGAPAFARGMELFFDRCDGTAATVEDFLACFADSSGHDLDAFARWYDQAGTPTLAVSTHHDAPARTLRVDFAQTTPPTAGQPDKRPLVLPILLGAMADDGTPIRLSHPRIREADGLFVLEGERDSVVVADVPERPVLSVLRGFSAPVKLRLDLGEGDLLALLRHDSDPFNRWQSAQAVALRLLLRGSAGEPVECGGFAAALLAFLRADSLRDPAFAALVIAFPGESEVAGEIGRDVDPDAVHRARSALRREVGLVLSPFLRDVRDALPEGAAYSPDAASAGRRALRNAALDLLAAADSLEGETLALRQSERATNMTDRLAALSVLSRIPGEAREAALRLFAERWSGEPLVLDGWFALQAAIPEPGTLDRVRRLLSHPAFSLANPNRARSIFGSFAAANPTQFHRPDGAGYELLADAVLALNTLNPQIAARLLTHFGAWRTMTADRRGKAERSLRRIAAASSLSPDVADLVGRSLAP